jgi:uncharacterized protein (TIGR02231 family)
VKKILVLSLLAFLVLPFSRIFAADITAESAISAVTVYPDSALLTRQASFKVNAGEYRVILPDIIPKIDENSLRVQAGGSASVKLFGAQLKTEYLTSTPSDKIKDLQDQIQKLQDDVSRQQDIKRVLQEEKSFLDSIRFFANTQIPRELATKMPAPQDLDGTYKFIDAKLRENLSLVMDTEIKVRELNLKIEALQQELNKISGGAQKIKRSIIVDLEVVRPGSCELNVSYLVYNVRWQPLYDARADFAKSEVEMVSYGLVSQSTGEDWQDVEMSLSTAQPAIGGNLPYVAPWVLKPYVPRPFEGFAEDKMALRKSQSMAYNTAGMAGRMDLEEAAPAAAPVYAKARESGTAVVYALARKVSVKADGSEHKLPVSTQVLKANFEYSTYPRAVTRAYLGSRVKNADGLQLLGGRVNVFLDGDYVGASTIPSVAPAEEFDLYLGSDENVKVKRELVEKKSSDTIIGGIPAPNKTTTFKYKLKVENYKSKKITVKLFEAMPVSEEKRITVKINQVSAEPKTKDWQDRKGIWLWELELEKGAKQEITYSFTVEHPREMQVEGL